MQREFILSDGGRSFLLSILPSIKVCVQQTHFKVRESHIQIDTPGDDRDIVILARIPISALCEGPEFDFMVSLDLLETFLKNDGRFTFHIAPNSSCILMQCWHRMTEHVLSEVELPQLEGPVPTVQR